MKYKKEGNAYGEKLLLGLVTEKGHGHEGSHAAAKDGEAKQQGLRDTPLATDSLALVEGEKHKSHEIEEYKAVEEEEEHGSLIYLKFEV